MRYYLGIICCAAFMLSCNGRNTATIKGHMASCIDDTVFLESVTPHGTNVVDSVITDKSGGFRFRVKLPDSDAALYNVRIGGDVMTLLVSPGEKVEMFSVCDNARNYEIKGSEGSALIKELSSIFYLGIDRLDSLRAALMKEADQGRRDSILNEYAMTYIRIKQDQIGFIIDNSTSPAAIYALYQRMEGDEVLFNGESDIIYYRMVADSVAAHHPGFAFLQPLQDMIARYDKQQELLMVMDEAKTNPVSFPEINMPDTHGNRIKLSSLKGNVVLLYFWSAKMEGCNAINAELKEIYAKYAPKGFEIYQVGVDDSKSLWLGAVQAQELPWISVSDLKGEASPAIGVYNITAIPSSFLFDKAGNVVAKDVFGDDLVAELRALLK